MTTIVNLAQGSIAWSGVTFALVSLAAFILFQVLQANFRHYVLVNDPRSSRYAEAIERLTPWIGLAIGIPAAVFIGSLLVIGLASH